MAWIVALLKELKPSTRIDYAFWTICVFFVLLTICTDIHSPLKDSELTTDEASGLAISKAEIADACTKNGQQCVRNVLLISGTITPGTIKSLSNLTRGTANQFEYVCFNSPGGFERLAVEVFDWIKTNMLKTCIAERYEIGAKHIRLSQIICGSACTQILLAGSSRLAIGRDFEYIVHNAGINLSLCFCEYPLNIGLLVNWKMKSRIDVAINPYRKQHLKLLEKSESIDYKSAYTLTWQEIHDYAVFTDYL